MGISALKPLGLALVVLGAVFASSAGLAQPKVVIYSSNDDTLHKLVFTAFTKETGIAVEPVTAGSGVVVKRIQTEKDRPGGDIVWGVSRSLLETNKQLFAPYRSKHHEAIPPELRDPADLWIGTNLHLMVILQNTKVLPEGQGPKAWADLLDPKWKGKIAFTDPANSGSAYTTITMLVELFGGGDAGWAKVKQLIANTRVLNRSSLVFQGVGNGEYPLGISLEYAGHVWAAGGAPVKTVYPADGTLAQMEGVAIVKGGPNAEAARAFVDYVNRKDVREMIIKGTFRRPARQDLDLAKLPGSMPALSALKLLPYKEEAWTAARAATLDKIKDMVQQTR
ncbi:MAG: extracellular solute-binding protein [Betaproteobacteria bacterium]|nr:extracellular solute-binding protein [Betaproteobacteria bacterium]